jgi:hypothetical protein
LPEAIIAQLKLISRPVADPGPVVRALDEFLGEETPGKSQNGDAVTRGEQLRNLRHPSEAHRMLRVSALRLSQAAAIQASLELLVPFWPLAITKRTLRTSKEARVAAKLENIFRREQPRRGEVMSKRGLRERECDAPE